MPEKIDPIDIIDDFRKQHTVVVYRENYYLYNGRSYDSCSKAKIEHLLHQHIERHFGRDELSPSTISSCRQLLATSSYIDGHWQPFWLSKPDEVASVLVCRDGIVDCEPMYSGGDPQLLPHTPELFATTVSEIDWNPNAVCPLFDRFLRWFTCGDAALEAMILEFLASIILRRVDHQRFLIMTGEGHNGKSVFLHMIDRLIGPENCSALPLERLAGRFDLVGLADHAVNIAADANEVTKVAEGNLKMLVDHSKMTYEQKYREAYKTINHARLIFLTNVSPRWRDRTDGLWRRMLLMACQAVIAGDEIVRYLEDQFDYSAVLNRVLAAGANLINRGDFDMPDVVLEAIAAERMDANPHRQFLVEHTCFDLGEFLVTDVVYARYREWCDARLYKALQITNFGKELKTHYRTEITAKRVKHGKSDERPRRNGYHGIAYCRNGAEDYWETKRLREQKQAMEQEQAAEQERRRREREEERAAAIECQRREREEESARLAAMTLEERQRHYEEMERREKEEEQRRREEEMERQKSTLVFAIKRDRKLTKSDRELRDEMEASGELQRRLAEIEEPQKKSRTPLISPVVESPTEPDDDDLRDLLGELDEEAADA